MSIGNKKRGGIAARQSYRKGKQKVSERLRQIHNVSQDGYGDNWSAIKKIVKRRDNYRCCRCHTQVLPENEQYSERVLMVDHRIPIARGGKTVLSNLWTLCDLCHESKPGSANQRGAALVKAVANQVRMKRRAKTK